MTIMKLVLPDEVISQLDLGSESFRDVPALLLAIDGLEVAASITTLASLNAQLPRLAQALRTWVTGRPPGSKPTRLLIKGTDVDIELVLPPNVSTASIIDAISKLLADG
jgi:hypothetical protein